MDFRLSSRELDNWTPRSIRNYYDFIQKRLQMHISVQNNGTRWSYLLNIAPLPKLVPGKFRHNGDVGNRTIENEFMKNEAIMSQFRCSNCDVLDWFTPAYMFNNEIHTDAVHIAILVHRQSNKPVWVNGAILDSICV